MQSLLHTCIYLTKPVRLSKVPTGSNETQNLVVPSEKRLHSEGSPMKIAVEDLLA